jgi:hypothetical protein
MLSNIAQYGECSWLHVPYKYDGGFLFSVLYFLQSVQHSECVICNMAVTFNGTTDKNAIFFHLCFISLLHNHLCFFLSTCAFPRGIVLFIIYKQWTKLRVCSSNDVFYISFTNFISFLGAFSISSEKRLLASSCLSVCLPVHLHHLSFHQTYLRQICYYLHFAYSCNQYVHQLMNVIRWNSYISLKKTQHIFWPRILILKDVQVQRCINPTHELRSVIPVIRSLTL